ncbi:MAG: hypothetical protein JXD23_14580 [Spirochaetales bacterium]|nr:hypothetical protein [Spirochaetales bacterium]
MKNWEVHDLPLLSSQTEKSFAMMRIYAIFIFEVCMQYTAIIKEDHGWWIGWIEEVPGVNCREKTHDELITSLRETLKEAIDFNKNDAIISAGKGFKEEIIAI